MAESRGRPVKVLTIGTFDCFHEGHRRLLLRADGFGDLFVGVNSDRFVESYKGRAAADNYGRRAAKVAAFLLDELGSAEVRPNYGPGIDLIHAVLPDLLVIGSDWLPPRDYMRQIGTTSDELAEIGVPVLFLPRTPDISTTALREAM